MSIDDAKEARERIGLVLERARENAEALPDLQRAYDQIDWVVGVVDAMPPGSASGDTTARIAELGSTLKDRASHLPVGPRLDLSIVNGITSAAAASDIVYAVVEDLSRCNDPEVQARAGEIVPAYQQHQETQDQVGRVRGLFVAKRLAGASERFEAAVEAFGRYKAQVGTEMGAEIAAGQTMRVFLDGLQGELWDRVRKRHEQGVSHAAIIERLYSRSPTRVDVERVFAQRQALYNDCGRAAKDWRPWCDLEAAWARVLDHALVLLNALE